MRTTGGGAVPKRKQEVDGGGGGGGGTDPYPPLETRSIESKTDGALVVKHSALVKPRP